MSRGVLRWRAAGAVVAVALACGACGGSDPAEPRPPSLTGAWSGTVQATGQSYTMSLTQSGNAVTGTGTVLDLLGAAGTSITGTTSGFNVTLEISFPNTQFLPVAFTGSFDNPSTLRGTLNFSREQVRDPITFRRQ